MRMELLPETSADLHILTRLSAGENFIDFCRRKIFKTFSENIPIELKKNKGTGADTKSHTDGQTWPRNVTFNTSNSW